MTSVSSFDEVPKKTFAEWIGVTTRQVTNLQEAGLPVRAKGNRVFVKWPEALHWYIRRTKEAPGEAAEEKTTLTLRRLELEVQMQELVLAREQEQLITLDYMEEQLGGALERLRAKMLNIPGKYAPAMVGLRSVAEGQVRLEGMVAEAMAALSETGEDAELDADDDTPDS